MADIKKRRPSPSLLFHTKRSREFGIGNVSATTLFPIQHITSIETENNLKGMGSFSIRLSNFKINGNDRHPFYYRAVQPLDLVEINLNENTTMIGIVDKVNKYFRMTLDGPQQGVVITGRPLSAIWSFDLVKYFVNTLGLDTDLEKKNLTLQTGEISLDFLQKPPYTAITTIYDKMPTFDMKLFGDKVLNDFLDVGSELFVRSGEKVFNTQISPYSGSLWNYFQKYVQAPFSELWTDSRDRKLFMRSRPTPFSLFDNEQGESPEGAKEPFGWSHLKNWVDGEPHHIINDSDLISESLDVDHSRAYSHFAVLPSDRFVGKENEYATFPPLIDAALAHEIGVRDMQIRLNYIPLIEGDVTDGTLERHKYYRDKIYLWNRDNHRTQSGTMTVKGNPDIRVGDKLFRSDTEETFYIVSVGNRFVYGKPFTTTVAVDRGLIESDRKKLYQAGLDFLKGAK